MAFRKGGSGSLADLCSEVKRGLGSAQRLSGAAQALVGGDPSEAASISVSLGSGKSQSNTAQTSDSARGSTVKAGGNVNIVAQGAGANSSILVRGSDITAGQDATFAAEGDIRLCVWCLISSLRPKAFQSHRPQPSRPWCWGRFLLVRPTAHWACRRS
ncbi:hemagglutinin repeat-containing protein [Comamonas thiooxydans]|uniref:hemagglutinin repeat-containing protein n=1 Tax=Comamonas thiooxydans TaxID=363952 RepID=UPI003C7D923A